jgi:hypothetical protein
MRRYRRLARANINRARSQLAKSVNSGDFAPLAKSYYRQSLSYLGLALLALDRADRLNQHKDQHQGGRSA